MWMSVCEGVCMWMSVCEGCVCGRVCVRELFTNEQIHQDKNEAPPLFWSTEHGRLHGGSFIPNGIKAFNR